MNDLIINYGDSKSSKILSLIIGGYSVLYGLYNGVQRALVDSFGFDFYLSIIAIVLGLILILKVTQWAPKPIVIINAESLYINMSSQKSVYTSEWINVKEIFFGISYIKIQETDGKTYSVDLSGLKYNDLKDVKARLVEYCEYKNIPYKND